MINSSQISTGTDYNATVALLIVAFVFSPAVLVLSGPFGHVSVSLAAGFSLVCAVLAWANWSKRATLTIPSIVDRPSRTR